MLQAEYDQNFALGNAPGANADTADSPRYLPLAAVEWLTTWLRGAHLKNPYRGRIPLTGRRACEIRILAVPCVAQTPLPTDGSQHLPVGVQAPADRRELRFSCNWFTLSVSDGIQIC